MRKALTLFLTLTALSACSGGGSSDSGMLIEGSLTEAGGASHSRIVQPKHSAGQRIENVEICALGECSVTDGEGQWGFVAGEGFAGGAVLFTIEGHGIDTSTVVNIPAGANDIFLDLAHLPGGVVHAQHITVDGVTQHNEVEGHDDHAEGEHAE